MRPDFDFDFVDVAAATAWWKVSRRDMRRRLPKDLPWDQQHTPPGFKPWNDEVMDEALPILYADRAQNDAVWQVAAATFAQAISGHAPSRFLGKALAEAFLQTAVPALSEPPPLVLPVFRLFLPEGVLLDEIGSPVDCLVIADSRSVDSLSVKGGGHQLMVAATNAAGQTLAMHSPWATIGDGWMPLEGTVSVGPLFADASLRMLALAVNVILVLAHRPDLVSEGPIVRPPGRGFKASASQQRPLAPIWIGLDYKAKAAAPSSGERRLSPGGRKTAHWRRGHWHTVCTGEGRKQRQQRWFEPTWVDADD